MPRKKTYPEVSQARGRSAHRKELRRRMKEKQAPFKPKTKQKHFGDKEK